MRALRRPMAHGPGTQDSANKRFICCEEWICVCKYTLISFQALPPTQGPAAFADGQISGKPGQIANLGKQRIDPDLLWRVAILDRLFEKLESLLLLTQGLVDLGAPMLHIDVRR